MLSLKVLIGVILIVLYAMAQDLARPVQIYGGGGQKSPSVLPPSRSPRRSPANRTPRRSPANRTPRKSPRRSPRRSPGKSRLLPPGTHEVKPGVQVSAENIALLYSPGELLSHTNGESATSFTRIIDRDAPRLAYKQAGQFPIKTCIHWGQLKLMLTEVEFISLALQARGTDPRPIYLIYPGSAPGHHIDKLSEMFPDVYFELYDPNQFIPQDTDKIKTHVQFFMDADAKRWRSVDHPDKFIIFNTDIRTFPATPKVVADNMQMQRGWFDIMRPELSMFKFRLPWTPGITEYPEGEIYIQPFPGQSSTETRLIVKKDAPNFLYDHHKYEEQCAYHNNVMRAKSYSQYQALDLHRDALDNCYDCTAFLEICHLYLSISGLSCDAPAVIALAQDIAAHIVPGKNLITQTDKEYDDKIAKLRAAIFTQCKKKCRFCTIPENNDHAFNANRMHSHADVPQSDE